MRGLNPVGADQVSLQSFINDWVQISSAIDGWCLSQMLAILGAHIHEMAGKCGSWGMTTFDRGHDDDATCPCQTAQVTVMVFAVV